MAGAFLAFILVVVLYVFFYEAFKMSSRGDNQSSVSK